MYLGADQGSRKGQDAGGPPSCAGCQGPSSAGIYGKVHSVVRAPTQKMRLLESPSAAPVLGGREGSGGGGMACQGATQEKTQRQKCGKKEAQCAGSWRDAVSSGEDEPP